MRLSVNPTYPMICLSGSFSFTVWILERGIFLPVAQLFVIAICRGDLPKNVGKLIGHRVRGHNDQGHSEWGNTL